MMIMYKQKNIRSKYDQLLIELKYLTRQNGRKRRKLNGYKQILLERKFILEVIDFAEFNSNKIILVKTLSIVNAFRLEQVVFLFEQILFIYIFL